MYSVKRVHDGGSLRGSKSIIYTPKRKDKYVVCVNAGLIFAVFMPEQDQILFFINETEKKKGSYRPGPYRTGFEVRADQGSPYVIPSPSATTTAKKKKKKAPGRASSTRMSPTIFSTWFVRSDERMPDVRMWPDQAYATWVALQMNAISVNGDYRLSVNLPRSHDYLFQPNTGGLGNFGSGKRSKDRGTVKTCLQYAIKVGMTRLHHQSGGFSSMMGRPFGPTMEDLEQFHRNIKGWMKNPRIRKSLESELKAAEISGIKVATKAKLQIQQILEGIQKND